MKATWTTSAPRRLCAAPARLTQRPCGPGLRVAPRPARVSTVSVVAFKSEDRKDKLVSAAREFIDLWAQGTRGSGPNAAVLSELNDLVDPSIKVQAVHPLGNVEFSGVEGLKRKLVLDANFKSSMRPNRVLLAAADPARDVVFCLLECEEMGSMDEDVNIVLLELHCVGKTYGIVKLNVKVDDDAARVTAVTERMQLGPADTCLLNMLYPDHQLHETLTEDEREEKENAGKVALQMASTWHFPREHIKPRALKGEALEAAKQAMAVWCQARNSGQPTQKLLEGVVMPEGKFGLWDPYGVLPTVCGVRDEDGKCTYKGVEATSHANCVMDLDSVVNRLDVLKTMHEIDCQLLDSAVASNHNIGFAHWRSAMRHIVYTKDGPVVDHDPYFIEAMAVFIFNSDGKIKDTWLLRDPYEAEKGMMMSICSSGNLPAK